MICFLPSGISEFMTGLVFECRHREHDPKCGAGYLGQPTPNGALVTCRDPRSSLASSVTSARTSATRVWRVGTIAESLPKGSGNSHAAVDVSSVHHIAMFERILLHFAEAGL